MVKNLKENLDRIFIAFHSLDHFKGRVLLFLISYSFLLFFGSYRLGVGALLALGILSFVDLSKIKTYNFVEKLFEGDDIEKAISDIKKLNQCLEASGIGIFNWNFEEEEFYWTDLSAQIFGQDAGYKPANLEEFWNLISEQDQEIVKINFQVAMNNRKPFYAEFSVLKKDGTTVWISLNGKIFYEDNLAVSFSGTFTQNDISEERSIQSENHFQEITDSVPQLIWVTNADGKTEYYNKRWVEYTGVDIEMSHYASWKDILHPDDVSMAASAWEKSLKTGEIFDIEYRLKSKADNSYRWFQARGVAIKSKDGEKIKQWFGICNDIHDLKQMQAQLADTLVSRDQFLSLASHELRTPLTALRLQANLLEFSVRNQNTNVLSFESLKRMAVTTDRQVTRLAKLVDDLLDISRIKLDRFSLDPSPNDINDIVKDCIDRVSFAYDEAKVKPPMFTPSEKAIGYWDRMRIEQVVQNLLTNALRYGRKNDVEIALQIQNQSICLSVKDRGIGISDQHIDKIFDLYYRGVGDEEENGLGLGLFIVKKIVEAHKGSIKVRSKPNEGSEFFVELPLDFRTR